MFEFIVENEKGEKINLTNSDNYLIDRIEGLDPPDNTINMSKIPGFDGEQYNSSSANKRQIVLYIDLLPPVEANRLNLYKYFKGKKNIKLYYKNDSLDVYIEGRVETVNVNHFTRQQQLQIPILCPQPYFKDIEEMLVNMSMIEPMFEFPFDISSEGQVFSEQSQLTEVNVTNLGTVDTGMTMILRARSIVKNPKIYNRDTAEYFGLNFEMQLGDEIIVNTHRGSKAVQLIREGVEINLFNYIMSGSKFLNLSVGDNLFVYEAEVGTTYLDISFKHQDQYEGV